MTGTTPATSSDRLHWIDNLRAVLVLLVVLYHVGGVYESTGIWGTWWIVDDPATVVWVGIVGIPLDVFVMPTLFLVSGYLAAASVARKSAREFLSSRLRRLMLPWALAVLTLIPAYKLVFLASRGLPQEHWTTYFHLTSPTSQNWLWFLPVLFLFDVLLLALSSAGVRLERITPGIAALGACAVGFAYSSLVGGLVGFRSWTLTPLLDFENERLLPNFLAFLFGALAFGRRLFRDPPRGKRLYNLANALAWLPITAHIFARIVPFLSPEGFTVTPGYRLLFWATFYLTLVTMIYVMVESFRRYADRSGPAWALLSRNSYGVYVLHVIVLGLLAWLLLGAPLPGWGKYLTLFTLTSTTSNLLVWAYREKVRRLMSTTHRVSAGAP